MLWRSKSRSARFPAAKSTLLAAALIVFAGVAGPALLSQQTVKVDVNLVNVFVTVQDEQGQFVTNLTKDDFLVYEDDEPQPIAVFEKHDAVRSAIAMLMDTSGSMVDILPYMTKGVRDFTRTLPSPNEYFIVTFGTNVRLIHRPSDSQQNLEQALRTLKPWGTSVFFDALLFGMDKVNTSDNERKALVVFSDGNDNGSTLTYRRITQEAQASGVLMYFIAIGAPVLVDTKTLESLSKASGGRTFYVPKKDAIDPVLDKIRTELANQYYVGYYAPRRSGYHRIRVEIPGKNYRIHSKTGYLGG